MQLLHSDFLICQENLIFFFISVGYGPQSKPYITIWLCTWGVRGCLGCIGPSSFDCVYNFSQASLQHKYTVHDLTPGLRKCTHGPELPCLAGTLPPMTDPMYSLIRSAYWQITTS
jgi:hypothetical protein